MRPIRAKACIIDSAPAAARCRASGTCPVHGHSQRW